MKIRLKIVFTLCLCFSIYAKASDDITVAVISDVHVMSPTLLKQDGKAFADYVAHDRKMLKESSSLMLQATERIISEHPDYVFVVGDLTKDGETVSHEYLRDNFLARMKRAGIDVFVISGNHDVNNPHAVEFLGDTTKRVPTPSKEQFATLYNNYGYGQALARDPHSLSYVVALNDHTRLLCLDACEYEQNDFGKNTCITAGRLKPETVAFIKQQAAEAKQKGCRLLAMMHHGVVQHWTWQEKAMSEYLVDDWRKQADMLARQGIEIVFTGHFHSQDMARRGSIFDVETGSLVSYPSPYRIVKISENTVSIQTKHLDNRGISIPNDENLQQYGARYAHSGIHTIVGDMLPDKFPADLKSDICDMVAAAYVAHLAGDESFPQEKQAEINAISKRIKHFSWKYAYIFKHIVKYLWTDLEPQDNNLTITLKEVEK